jgi:hypothetical protein
MLAVVPAGAVGSMAVAVQVPEHEAIGRSSSEFQVWSVEELLGQNPVVAC